MGINANDLAISELTPLSESKDNDLFILSQPNDDKTYTTYSQTRKDLFGNSNRAFQLANPALRTIWLDYDPNEDPVYGGDIYWEKAGNTIKLNDTDTKYYDQLERLKAFLSSELNTSNSRQLTINISKSQTLTIDCSISKSGLIFTTEGNKADSLYQQTGVSWFYVVNSTTYSNLTTLTLPKTRWGFVGNRGNIGQYVNPGLPNHQHDVNVYASNCSCKKTAGIRNSHYAQPYVVKTENTYDTSGIYGSSDTVQPPATQMGLWFAL